MSMIPSNTQSSLRSNPRRVHAVDSTAVLTTAPAADLPQTPLLAVLTTAPAANLPQAQLLVVFQTHLATHPRIPDAKDTDFEAPLMLKQCIFDASLMHHYISQIQIEDL